MSQHENIRRSERKAASVFTVVGLLGTIALFLLGMMFSLPGDPIPRAVPMGLGALLLPGYLLFCGYLAVLAGRLRHSRLLWGLTAIYNMLLVVANVVAFLYVGLSQPLLHYLALVGSCTLDSALAVLAVATYQSTTSKEQVSFVM